MLALARPHIVESRDDQRITYISGDRIRDGDNSAVSIRALGVGLQPTTTIRYGAFGVLSIVEA